MPEFEVTSAQSPEGLTFAFLLLPGFSLISFSSAIEPIHKANHLLGFSAYRLILVSVDGHSVQSSSHVSIQVNGDLDAVPACDTLFICGTSANSYNDSTNNAVIDWLKLSPSLPTTLGGIASGSEILIKANLLDGYRVARFRDDGSHDTPNIIFTRNLFELDRQRFTCSGGSASMDMVLAMIGQQHNVTLSASIAEILIDDRQGRYARGKATIQASGVNPGPEPKLREALDLMLSNIEEPLGADELAFHVGVSRRQLERLFRQNLQTAPSKYYLQLRLEKARKLLITESASVVQIALATGFSNASHFSTAYRNFFQLTPREERQRARDNSLNALKHSLPTSKPTNTETN